MDRHALNAGKHCALDRGGTSKRLKNFLNKSYTLQRNERYGEFLRILGVEKAAESKATVAKPTVVLSEKNGEYIWKTMYPKLNEKHIMKFKMNEPIVRRLSTGVTVVSLFQPNKNQVVERQTFDDGRLVVVTREFFDDLLVIVMELENFKSYRFFEASLSVHTIQTETSRRQSLVEPSKITLENLDPDSEPEEAISEAISDEEDDYI